MRLMDVDKFLDDLSNEGFDVINADARCPAYSEFGYSYDLIERVIERQNLISLEEQGEQRDKSFKELMTELRSKHPEGWGIEHYKHYL